jgi:hypothetical protein
LVYVTTCLIAYVIEPIKSNGCMIVKECGTNRQWPIWWHYVTINLLYINVFNNAVPTARLLNTMLTKKWLEW